MAPRGGIQKMGTRCAVDGIWAAAWAHRDRLLRIARSRLASPDDAEDCVQEAIIRCAVAPDVDLARVGALLTTITVRLCVDVHRSHACAGRAYSRLESATTTFVPADDDAVCDRVDAARVAPSLDRLGARERAVIEARAAGFGPAEAARALGITVKAAESAFTRARVKIRRQLEPPVTRNVA